MPLIFLAFLEKVAGVVGFEPTIHGTKNRCLTTWLHPNGERLSTIVADGVQEVSDKKVGPLEKILAALAAGSAAGLR